MSISSIVNVQITRQTQSVSTVGFGTPMILGTFKNWNDKIRTYLNMSAVAADFSSNQLEYQAAQSAFSQSPTVAQLKIGRRQADDATIDVISSIAGKTYTVNIQGVARTITAANANLESVATMSADFVSLNRINVSLNGTTVGTVTSIISFNIDFVSLNSIVATVNGVALSATVFTSDQATTLAALATKIGTATGVSSSTVTGARQITVVFTSAGNNTVTTVVTTLGASQPTATISEGGFVFDTSQLTTMTNLQTALAAMPNISSVQILADGVNPNRKLKINADPGYPGVIDFLTVTLGASQPTATIVNTAQTLSKASIARQLTVLINGSASNTIVTADDSAADGTFTLTGVTPDLPYTLSVSTNIINSNSGIVTILDSSPRQLYQITLNGTLIQYTSPVSVLTSEEISLAMVALINAQVSITSVSAVDNADGTFTLSSSSTFVCQITPFIMSYQFGILIEPLVATASVTDSLDEIQIVDDDWYALACTDRTSATVQEIASWIETKVKIFGTSSLDANIIDEAVGVDTTSIAAIFQNLGYTRSFVLYHQDADTDFPECAWFGVVLPTVPGSETWMFKTLAGISFSDLSDTQNLNCLNKDANNYQSIGGRGITQQGTVASGEYIDVIRGTDWLVSTIQSQVYGTLVNSLKVPYTDAGIAAIESQIMNALEQGVTNGFLTNNPAPETSVPKAINVSQADKAARILRNVTFQATIAGAIQAVNIQGTLTI